MRHPFTGGLALLLIVLSSFCMAQVPSLAVLAPSGELLGPPKNPTISAVTPLWQGVLSQANTEQFSGPVAEVTRVNVIPEGAAPNPYRGTTTFNFDSNGHLVDRMDESSRGRSTTAGVYQDGRIQSSTTKRYRANGTVQDSQWRKWSYDPSGGISDYRAGTDGNQEKNHYLNFRFDAKGRLLGCEYRQGGSDTPFFFTEFKYGGKTVTSNNFDENHRKTFEEVRVLDGSNHVVELSISDLSDGALKLWYHTKFKYDEQGRLTEQFTDQYNYAPGDEDSEPPPGRVAVLYDDKKNTGEQDFYDPGGKLLARSLAQFDPHGYVTKVQVLGADGKPADPNREIWRDPKTHKDHSGTYTSEASYDDHGNWTELRSWFTPADGSDRILTRSIKQTITYR